MTRIFNLNRKELKQYKILKLNELQDTDYTLVKVKGNKFIAIRVNENDYKLNHRVDRMCKLGGYLVTIEKIENGYKFRGIDLDKASIVSLGVFNEFEIFNDCIKVVTRLGNKLIIDGWYLDDEMQQGWY